MKRTFRSVALTTLALSLVLPAGGAALAQSAVAVFPCGRVTAFKPPTATTAGSIRIGTTTFVAAPGSLPNPAPPLAVGFVVCLTGTLDANGAFVSLTASTFGDVVCGRVSAFTPASGTAAGSLALVTNTPWTLPVRAGVQLSPAQTTGSQCLKYELNGDGNAEVVGFSGPTPAAGQLPNTTTEPGAEPGTISPALGLAVLGAALIGAVAFSRLRSRSH